MGAAASALVGQTTPRGTSGTTIAKKEVLQRCRFGAACYNHDPEHRRLFVHPGAGPGGAPHRRRACKYGLQCHNDDLAHSQEFVHPGDRNYRLGLVVFASDLQGPEFETLWQLFNYYDPEESGHLTKDEFALSVQACGVASGREAAQQAWVDVGGQDTGAVNFARFSSWAASAGIDMPLGLDKAGEQRPCRCRLQTSDGERFRCGCQHFVSRAGSDGLFCECGHKASMHRSNVAERPPLDLRTVKIGGTSCPPTSTLRCETGDGLVQLQDKQIATELQRLLTSTHKITDNWTRDRGCSIHGVNGCSVKCACENRSAVPKGYTLRKVFRNQNSVLWQRYCLARSSIMDECGRGKVKDVRMLSQIDPRQLDAQLESSCNEWHVFHGTRLSACRDICNSNFRPILAGTGATWKDAGKDKGVPLYGFGIYLAERITKADEYAKPALDMQLGAEVCAVLVVRCVAGRVNVVTTNDINTERLRKDVFDGPYHSVLGDRVSSLGKPYREVVVYDKDQCFPEYMLLYERQY